MSSAGALQPQTTPEASAAPLLEVPSGMEAAAALLEAFCAIPNISKLHVRQGEQPGQQMLTVRGDKGSPFGRGMWKEGRRGHEEGQLHVQEGAQPGQQMLTVSGGDVGGLRMRGMWKA